MYIILNFINNLICNTPNMNSKCSPESRKILENILSDNKIVLISHLGHPLCEKITKLFKHNSIDFLELDILHPDNEYLIYCLDEKTKSRFKPQLFLNSQYIGGYTEGLNHFVLGKFNNF